MPVVQRQSGLLHINPIYNRYFGYPAFFDRSRGPFCSGIGGHVRPENAVKAYIRKAAIYSSKEATYATFQVCLYISYD